MRTLARLGPFLGCFALLGIVPCGQAQNPAWTAIGPPGGVAFDLVVSLADPQVMWAVTTWGLYRSTNAGVTWGPASAGWWLDRWLPRLALSPVDADTAFLCVPGEALGRTTDGGATWRTTSPLAAATAVATVPAAVPFTVLAAGDRQTVLRSSDLGETWGTVTTLINPEYSSSPVHRLVPTAVDSGVLYAQVGDALCRSDDGGAAWWCTYLISLGGVAAHPAEPLTVYASFGVSSSSLHRSDNGGESWHALGEAPGPPLYALAFDPSDPLTLHAAAGEGLFRTTDRGETWAQGGVLGYYDRPRAVALDPSDPRVLVVGGELDPPGVWRSTDRGETWATGAEGLPGGEALSVTTSRAPETEIYVAGRRLERSRDRGASWETLLHRPVASVAVDPRSPSTLWVATGWPELLHSTDSGGSWTAMSGLAADWVLADPHRAGTLYARESGWPHRSDDSGATWQPLQSTVGGAQWSTVVPHPRRAGVLLMTGWGLARSWDWGESWEAVEGLPEVTAPCFPRPCAVFDIAVDHLRPDSIVVATECGLYASDDWGTTWRPSADGLPGVTCGMNAWGCYECDGTRLVEANPVRPGMLVVLAGTELYSSHDCGATWQQLPAMGLVDPEHVLSYQVPARLTLTGDGNGVLFGTDAGLYAFWLDQPRRPRGRWR